MKNSLATIIILMFLFTSSNAQNMFTDSLVYSRIPTTGWTATAASVLSFGQSEGGENSTPDKIIDGNNGSFWSTNQHNSFDTADIYLSLGKTVIFDGFYFVQRDRKVGDLWDRGVSDIMIYVSQDSIHWSLTGSYALDETGAYQRLPIQHQLKARFIKLHIDRSFTTFKIFCIAEFGLLRANKIYDRRSYRYNASDEYKTTPCSALFDGDNDTYYESDWSLPDGGAHYPHSLSTDLGAVKPVNKFFYASDRQSNFKRAFAGYLRFSKDSLHWFDSIPVTFEYNNTGVGCGIVGFPTVKARYISLSITYNKGLGFDFKGDLNAFGKRYPKDSEMYSYAFAVRLNEIAYGYEEEERKD